ncbi:MAG: hypothetical protein JXA96_01400 [Sedimentisphaerales bacterium]|nr:hypothetical protein [Sedimentisphaerales bacterium]
MKVALYSFVIKAVRLIIILNICMLLGCSHDIPDANVDDLIIYFNHIGECDKPLMSFCVSDLGSLLETNNNPIMLRLPINKVNEIRDAIESATPAIQSEFGEFGTFEIIIEEDGYKRSYIITKSDIVKLGQMILMNLPESNKLGSDLISGMLKRLLG